MYPGDLSRKKMVSGDIVKNLVDFLSYIEPYFLCNVCVTGAYSHNYEVLIHYLALQSLRMSL